MDHGHRQGGVPMSVVRSRSTNHKTGYKRRKSEASSRTSGNNQTHRISVRVLFGLFEADASGSQGICAVIVMFVSFGVGRCLGLW